jgi:ATP-dependent DNA helicase RecQ
MHGPGDEDVQQHFIETAFPRAEHIEATIKALAQHGPMSRTALQQWVNVNPSTLEKILTHLEVEKIIEKQERDFHLLNANARPDYARWGQVTRQRYHELDQMQAYIRHEGCLMRFIADALDDPTTVQPCGKCKNCRKQQSKFQADPRALQAAQIYLRQGRPIALEPRKRWPSGFPGVKRATIEYVNEEGLALCTYYDVGWGNLVREGRSSGGGFSAELLAPSVELLRKYLHDLSKPPSWVTSVPSLRRPNLVANFARQVAQALGLPYHEAVRQVRQHAEQNMMRNSFQQAMNVREAFALNGEVFTGPVLLVDDLADSRWTLTVIGEMLRRAGSGAVYPFVLAMTNTGVSS